MAELRVDAPLKPKEKRPIGRPSIYDDGILDALCDRIMAGEGVKSICRDEAMPREVDVYRAAAKDDEICSRIARAREAQQDAIVDDIIAMADAATVENHQVVKLRIWARQWQASKLAPKKYGDRIQTDATVNANVTGDMTMRLQAMSDDELARILTDAASIASAGGGVGTSSQTGS